MAASASEEEDSALATLASLSVTQIVNRRIIKSQKEMTSKKDQEKDQDIRDAIQADKSRGTKRPRSVAEIKLRRDIQKAFRQITDSDCTREEFLNTIRILAQTSEALVIQKLLDAWDAYHGKN